MQKKERKNLYKERQKSNSENHKNISEMKDKINLEY
jgi:hypothetical protein